MDTNYQMLRKLDATYKPKEFGIATADEVKLVEEILHIKEMDILQLRNLRDFTVMFYGSRDSYDREKMDKMSAITYIIDSQIVKLGGEV